MEFIRSRFIKKIIKKNIIDPSDFSWTLMENAKEIVKMNPNIILPLEIMNRAYYKLKNNNEVKAGT
jgi:hypothetical protein